MAALRLRVELGFAPPGELPQRLWWAPPPGALTITELLEELGAHLGLGVEQRTRLAASMGGYAVLGSNSVDLLRDGDALVVSLSRKRGAAAVERAADEEGDQPPAKRRRGQQSPLGTWGKQVLEAGIQADSDTGLSTAPSHETSSSSEEEDGSSSSSSSEESSSSSSEESSSSEDEGGGAEGQQGFNTPTAAAEAPAGEGATTGKRPSRSARRKAAQRRLRRMGVLPGGGTSGRVQAAQEAAQTTARAPPAAAAKDAPALQPKTQPKQPAGPPEVTVPAEWQAANGAPRHRQQEPRRRQQQEQQEEQEQHQADSTSPAAAAPAAAPAPQPAMTDAAFGWLPLLAGEPSLGDVLAYRLLEIGADLQPAVSEVRCGRVIGVEAGAVTLEPHPNPSVHPLAYRRAVRRAQLLAEAEATGEELEGSDEEEEPGSQYDEEGVLVEALTSFVELRVVQSGQRGSTPGAAAAAAPAAPAAPKATAVVQAAAAAALAGGGSADAAELGPGSYSQLGPPRPAAARGDVIAAQGGWAALYEQLQKRRSQLAEQQPAQAAQAAAETPPAPRAAKAAAANGVQSAPPAAGGRGGAAAGRPSLTPGATRPPGGVRRSALGPMLRHLRESQEFQQ